MTWLDLASVAGFFLLVYLASKRGVVLEITDIICIVVGGLFAFRSYRPLASGLHSSIFKGFSIGFLEKFCLFGIFILSCMVLFAIGLTIQRRAKEEHVLEKDVDEKLGILVGLFKAALVIMLCVGLLFYKEAFPAREIRRMKQGPVVSKMIGLSGAIKPVVYIVAPQDLAKDYMTYGLARYKARPKEKPKSKTVKS
ncbi:MAG TPA: CvpA family protein [Phycisphaerales bacterium]|nr:CvpA family protein [Phycisphaerales bacterium]